MCFRVQEEGFKDGKEMEAKGVSTTLANIACTINNLSLLVAFVAKFITFSSYPTIDKE
jgi:hypothetical protein